MSSQRSAWAAATLALSLLTAFVYGFAGHVGRQGAYFAFNDAFHQGEYFAVGQSLAETLTIHGALDFLPNLLATQLVGNDHQFLATHGLYALLGMLAVLLLSAIHLKLSHAARPPLAALGLSLMAALTVGYRDLLLLACLAIFYALLRGPSRRLLHMAFGVVAAMGLYWSYDRGLVATIALGSATLYLAWSDRRYLLSLLSYAGTMLILNYMQGAMPLATLVENILVLSRTSAEWRYPPVLYFQILLAFAWMVNLMALAAFWLSHLSAGTIRQNAGEAIALTLMAGLLLKIGTNRPDLQHIHFALWAPGLLILRMNPAPFRFQGWLARAGVAILIIGAFVGFKYMTYCAPLVAVCLLHAVLAHASPERQRFETYTMPLALMLTLGAISLRAYNGIKEDGYAWLQALPAQQTNWQSAEPAMQWVAAELARVRAPCVFDLTNNGIINGLAKLPACSRFTYPVYASRAYESELVESLARTNPPALVYSSAFWSYRIDGRAMKSRFPKLDQFIRQKYPLEQCGQGYCLRYQPGA